MGGGETPTPPQPLIALVAEQDDQTFTPRWDGEKYIFEGVDSSEYFILRMTFENEVTEQQVIDTWAQSADNEYLSFVEIDGNTVVWDGEPTPLDYTVHIPEFGDNNSFEYLFT